MVVFISSLFFLIQFGLMFGLRTAGSLFNNRAGADKLPYIYIIFGLITAFLTLFYTTGLNRLNKGRFFPIMLIASGGAVLWIRLYVPQMAPDAIPKSILLVEPVSVNVVAAMLLKGMSKV